MNEDDIDLDQGLEDMLTDDPQADGTEVPEDELGMPVEGEPEQSVAQVSLEQALQTLRAAGYEAVPEQLLTQEQTQQAASVVDYASQIQVPQEIADQGFDAEMNYRAQRAAEMTVQAAMAPIMGQQAAQHYATQLNMPESAGQLQQVMSETLGPNWYEAASNPQFQGMFNLMLKGFQSENAAAIPQNKVEVPKTIGVSRHTSSLPAGISPAGLANLTEMAKSVGMTVEQLTGAN